MMLYIAGRPDENPIAGGDSAESEGARDLVMRGVMYPKQSVPDRSCCLVQIR